MTPTTQGTVWSFDAATREGTVVLDDGRRLTFEAATFDASGLRLLRAGQRVRIEVVDGSIAALTILTLR